MYLLISVTLATTYFFWPKSFYINTCEYDVFSTCGEYLLGIKVFTNWKEVCLKSIFSGWYNCKGGGGVLWQFYHRKAKTSGTKEKLILYRWQNTDLSTLKRQSIPPPCPSNGKALNCGRMVMLACISLGSCHIHDGQSGTSLATAKVTYVMTIKA